MPRYRWALWSLLLLAGACGKTTVDQISSPGALRCQIALSSSSQDVPAGGMQFTVDVTAERECTWTTESSAAWVQPSPTTGQGEGTLTVKVSANTQPAGRTATLSVNDGSLAITQAAATPPCSYGLSPASRSFASAGGTATLTLQTGQGCAWAASTNVSWITLPTPSGTGSATITYVVARNQSQQPRSASVTVAGRTHLVVQQGR
jgi:hypothetical protein